MKILIVTATEEEIEPLLVVCRDNWSEIGTGTYEKGSLTLELLITGIGMVRTSYALGKSLALNRPDLCINAGIAGAFPGKFEIGDVVHVIQDCIPDIGATNSEGRHLSLKDMNLSEDISSTYGLVNAQASAFDFLPKADGITVNTVHGDAAGIMKAQESFAADIETMESAAFFYCCLKEEVSFVAIRGISNIVGPRDRSKWNIGLAIDNLNVQLLEVLDFLSS